MKQSRLTLSVLTAMTIAPMSFAATDGTEGLRSRGTSIISVTKGDSVQISNISDLLFSASVTTPAPQNMDSCIYSTTGDYNVEARSLNTDGANFRVTDGAATPSFVNYTLQWDDTVAAATGTPLAESTVATGFTNAFTADPTCGGGTSGRLIVTIQPNGVGGFATAPLGTYNDTLTMIVSPN